MSNIYVQFEKLINNAENASESETNKANKAELRKFLIEKGWSLNEQDEMLIASMSGMNIDEWTDYKGKQKWATKNAFADLCGMHPETETLYEDYIIRVVGKKFLYLFRRYKMIECCGIINKRKLYALMR